MYNFRYHLVTICAIFIALALGLVLGAGLSSSEFVAETSDNMVADLFKRFEQVEQQSAVVDRQNSAFSSLNKSFAENWQTDRLSGRVIAILAYADEDSQALAQQQSDLVKAGGGTGIIVSFSKVNLDSATKETAAQLEKIVKPVTDVTLNETLAKALVGEWILPLSKATSTTHPLSTFLLSSELINVSSNDIALLNTLATEQGIKSPKITAPVGINGIIDLLVQNDTDGTARVDDVGLAVVSDIQTLGQDNKLPYYEAKPTDPKSSTTPSTDQSASVDKDASYYAVVVQSGVLGSALASAVQELGLSCVVSDSGPLSKYSITALLSGGKIGIYNLEKPDSTEFPALPTDVTGNGAFIH